MSLSAPGGTVRPSAPAWPGEVLRGGLLLGWALWLTHPFLTSRLIGSGDAWWYGNMLRDYLVQLRHGIFPVWTGQTEFAFNGAVYPLRAAPYYQYLGGLLDLLSGRRFDAFTIQHGTVVVSLVAAAGTAYWSLCRLAPHRRNAAALLAAFYVACPGVLGLATSMDLYMSVMAIPFLPLVTCGLVLALREGGLVSPKLVGEKREIGLPASGSPTAVGIIAAESEGGLASPTCLAEDARRRKLAKREGGLVTPKPGTGEGGPAAPKFQRNEGGWRAQRMIVIGLALTWYAHAPLAAWLTVITIVVWAVRIGLHWRDDRVWMEAIGSALLFAALVAYVFASVATLRSADSAGLIPYAIDRDKIIAALRSAFPGCLLPVGFPAVNLGDLQLGYALWAALLAGAGATLLPGRRRFLAVSLPATIIVLMLLPVPGITAWLWHSIPESLARLTFYWPMHRLCPVLAALTLPLGMLALDAWLPAREVASNKDQASRQAQPRATGAPLSSLASPESQDEGGSPLPSLSPSLLPSPPSVGTATSAGPTSSTPPSLSPSPSSTHAHSAEGAAPKLQRSDGGSLP